MNTDEHCSDTAASTEHSISTVAINATVVVAIGLTFGIWKTLYWEGVHSTTDGGTISLIRVLLAGIGLASIALISVVLDEWIKKNVLTLTMLLFGFVAGVIVAAPIDTLSSTQIFVRKTIAVISLGLLIAVSWRVYRLCMNRQLGTQVGQFVRTRVDKWTEGAKRPQLVNGVLRVIPFIGAAVLFGIGLYFLGVGSAELVLDSSVRS